MGKYSKETEKALMGKEKHRILIFGKKTCGSLPLNINLDLCDIELITFPSDYQKLGNLCEYTIVILDYSVFSLEDSFYGKEQEVFEKQMLEALDSGTCFCILHYHDLVPDEDGIEKCRQLQIGFRWLVEFGILPFRTKSPIISPQLKRGEFNKYMNRWGASKIVFAALKETPFSDIIAGGGDDKALAFTLDIRRGKLIYMPCQRDFSRLEMLGDAFSSLIDSLITYLAKSRLEIPKWAEIPISDEEEKLSNEKVKLERKLEEYEEKLDIFHSAKQLLFQSEYGLEGALHKFLQEQCGMSIQREETYKEDFWLLDPEGKKIIICEVKSYVKGFKKSGLFNLYNHRESYGLDEEFPAVLFVNSNLNAASWKQKDRPIDEPDYKEAADKHILVVRIEDLLFLWVALREGIFDATKLLNILKNEVGWLNFKRDKSWEILR